MSFLFLPLSSLELLLLACAGISLVAWLYFMVGHGGFWRGDQRFDKTRSLTSVPPTHWPGVVVIVPARNEADNIKCTLGSLLDQNYPGKFHVILVDDHSEDGTGNIARHLANQHPAGEQLSVVTADERPPGWLGKVWALYTGLQVADRNEFEAKYRYLTDADILHSPGNLREMVAKAESEQLVLVSLMVRLNCRNRWENLLIPAYVYFFQKIYPFRWINDPRVPLGGAAGGCMLVKTEALNQAGGMEAIRGEVIDDCALGQRLKRIGKIWVGLTDTEHSIRPYERLADIWEMVTRTAFTQLRYSSWLLGLMGIGLLLLYVVPPIITLTWPLHGNTPAGVLSILSWVLMTVAFHPTLRLYSLPSTLGVVLPLIALCYLVMTVDSARRHWQQRGGQWKGRTV